LVERRVGARGGYINDGVRIWLFVGKNDWRRE